MNKRLLLLVCGLGVLGFSQAQPSRGNLVDNIVARVDDYIILRSELEAGYANYLARGASPSTQAKCEILQSLVLNKVLVAKAEIDSVIVDEGQVLSQLDVAMSNALAQFPNEAEFQRVYGKSVDEFRDELLPDMRENLTVQTMQRTITENITVTPREVKRFYQQIPRDSLPFFSTEFVVGQFVKKATTSEKEKQRVRDFLLDLRGQIQRGEATFEDLAREHSEDPGSGRKGGNLGFTPRGTLVPEYEEMALSLEPMEISDPVQSIFGYHMIQLLERRGNEINTRHILVRPRSTSADMEEAVAYLDSIRTLVMTDETVRWEKLSKEHSEDPFTASNGSYFTNPNVGGLRISAKELDSEVFFTIDTMQVGTYSKPLPYLMQDGTAAARIIYYKDRFPPHQANLEDDYQKIKTAVLQSKNNEALEEWFEKARTQVFIYLDPEFQNCRILN